MNIYGKQIEYNVNIKEKWSISHNVLAANLDNTRPLLITATRPIPFPNLELIVGLQFNVYNYKPEDKSNKLVYAYLEIKDCPMDVNAFVKMHTNIEDNPPPITFQHKFNSMSTRSPSYPFVRKSLFFGVHTVSEKRVIYFSIYLSFNKLSPKLKADPYIREFNVQPNINDESSNFALYAGSKNERININKETFDRYGTISKKHEHSYEISEYPLKKIMVLLRFVYYRMMPSMEELDFDFYNILKHFSTVELSENCRSQVEAEYITRSAKGMMAMAYNVQKLYDGKMELALFTKMLSERGSFNGTEWLRFIKRHNLKYINVDTNDFERWLYYKTMSDTTLKSFDSATALLDYYPGSAVNRHTLTLPTSEWMPSTSSAASTLGTEPTTRKKAVDEVHPLSPNSLAAAESAKMSLGRHRTVEKTLSNISEVDSIEGGQPPLSEDYSAGNSDETNAYSSITMNVDADISESHEGNTESDRFNTDDDVSSAVFEDRMEDYGEEDDFSLQRIDELLEDELTENTQ